MTAGIRKPGKFCGQGELSYEMLACRAEEAKYYRKEAEEAELKLSEARNKLL